uniref:Myoferlin n=1 Tax=Oncorhynchus kisutch TaxID=8019 RepID=A0A8C7GZ30_ONCKI
VSLGGQVGTPGVPLTPGQPGNPNQRPVRTSRKRHRALANKPQDFQIRIRVIEGRQLPGNNIKPVVKVNVCGQTHRTRIRRGNNPFFDEVIFSELHSFKLLLYSKIKTTRVYDSYSLRADSLMGEHPLCVSVSGMCIFLWSTAHAIMRKWLLLSDPGDSSSGAKGYLKVSLVIVGTGDEPPTEKRERNEEQDDIESNLLVPAGVTLRLVTLNLKVYRAEDMPQMDDAFVQTVKQVFGGEGDKKNLVDPYLEVSFAGKKLCTKIIEKNANPDQTNTTLSSGEAEVGFLPAFGPCYLNLYGSPREFTGLPDPYEELNFGKGEGVAYRGRVLIELSTQLDGKADRKLDNISSDDILMAQKYQRRRKFSLCAVFHSSCMLQEPGEPIQFEVSIGNYGNKLDSTCMPLASTTQYSCAVFDGNHYYYLPWADTKPVVILTSFWEDISHRLDSVNIILYIADRLLQYSFCSLMLASDSFQVPELEGRPNLTALDVQIKKLRDSAVASIREMAKRLKEEATDVIATLTDIEEWLERLKQLAEEPQNSMPDVVIWMLRGERRVAYARLPANQILYSTYSEQACGKYCGRTQTIFMQYPMDKNKGVKIPVQLRVNMWLGLSAHEKKFNSFSEGTFSVFAEMYENQAQVFGKWGTTGLVCRHKFSDVTGKVKLKQERFMPPRAWEWEGEWFVDPERGLLTEADAGHTEFTDEVYQNETRFIGGEWKAAADPFTDVNGQKSQSPGEIECPAGWKWEDDWSFDSNRAVDEKGWEYGVTIPPDDKPKSWGAAEKMYHIHRRKRLLRPRRKIADTKRRDPGEGWEYSSLIGWKFHRKERSSDTFRRRRWRRKMAPSDGIGASAIFRLEGALGVDVDEKASKKDAARLFGANTPTVSCNFDRSYMYHLRVYVYQARNLIAMDRDSFSDPYAHVSFLHVSKTTEVIRATLNPTWDQTLIFNDIEIYGDPQTIAHNPPNVVLELYDSDQVGKDEAMGRCTCPPVVKLNLGTVVSPKLLWFPVTKKGRNAGEMLVAAELLLKDKVKYFPANESDLPLVPPRRGATLYMVPQGIRPVVQLTAIEILAWGLRNMKTYQLATVTSPSLMVECGGEVVQTAVIKNIKKNPNFPGSVLFFKVLLPKEEIYTPPIVLKVIDHRPFGRKPIVGQCTLSLEEFRCDPYDLMACTLLTESECAVIEAYLSLPVLQEEEAVDWWSKFYASVGEHEKCGPYLKKGYDTLKVYEGELEEVPDFRGLTDFCKTFRLQRGKTEDEDDDPSVVGEFKGSFRVYPLSVDPEIPAPPRQFRELPESGLQECLVRIYVVRCMDLQPKDNNGMCDPYIKISLGKKTKDDRDDYKPNTLNPEFGRMFELSCFLPRDKDLKIAVYDYDLLTRDEKVGETVIDLENRLLSRFGAYCGLPQSYCISGTNQWRDQLKPSQILENLARLRGIPSPSTSTDGSTLSFGGRDYSLLDFEANRVIHQHLGPARERMALHVLSKQGLVPEHVETRTLYSTYQPTLSQGKIQMWVDIFPKSLGLLGPPCHITPRQAKKYFMRAIVWNTTDVILDETSITGENMSDIYVKGWMPGMEEDKQKTDVHYRSLDGDGNFNWRFVFGFDYLPAEQLCLVSRKEHFWNLDQTEFRTPPKLIVQIWDNDKFSLDDYLGTVELDLLHLIPPAKTPEKCSLKMLQGVTGSTPSKQPPPNSLFSQKSVRGWWPCMIEQDRKHILGGKVEMTLEIVEEREVEERPAGKGRDEPNMNPKLDFPNRPDTSFFWFTSPCKTMRFIIWRRFKWIFIGLIVLLLVLLFLGILLYSLPNYISMKIVKPFS